MDLAFTAQEELKPNIRPTIMVPVCSKWQSRAVPMISSNVQGQILCQLLAETNQTNRLQQFTASSGFVVQILDPSLKPSNLTAPIELVSSSTAAIGIWNAYELSCVLLAKWRAPERYDVFNAILCKSICFIPLALAQIQSNWWHQAIIAGSILSISGS